MTEMLIWPDREEEQNALVAYAVGILRGGGLVAYPTDTVYGLGADASLPGALQRIYQAKGRPDEKAIVWLVSSLDEAATVCSVNDAAHRLANEFWAGALTLILPLRKPTPGGLPTLGVRVPRHDVALHLIRAAGGMLATTSANRSGQPSARTAQEAKAQIGSAVDLIIDSGPAPLGVESSVVDLSIDPPALLRSGAIDAASIETALGRALDRRRTA